MGKSLLSGAELEAQGYMKFPCSNCRDAFPARCKDHQRRPPKKQPAKAKNTSEKPEKKKPHPCFGPMLDYFAPYDALEVEVENLRKSLR